MSVPGVVGPALDDHVAWPQSSFATFEDERCFSLQETDDVDRLGSHAFPGGASDR